MTAITFGDDEPEDAWHPNDPVIEQLRNLVRRAELLEGRHLRFSGDPDDVLEALGDLVAKARRRRLNGREIVRVNQLDEDISYVAGRL